MTDNVPLLAEALENLRQTSHYDGGDRQRIAAAIRQVAEALRASPAPKPKQAK